MCFRFNRHVPLLDEDEGRESGRSELGHRCCGLTALRVTAALIAIVNLAVAAFGLIRYHPAYICIYAVVASLVCLYAVAMRAALAYSLLIIQFAALTFLSALGCSVCILALVATQFPAVRDIVRIVLIAAHSEATVEDFQSYCSLVSFAFLGIAVVLSIITALLYFAYKRTAEHQRSAQERRTDNV